MVCEPAVRLRDQRLVEPPLAAAAGFVAGDRHDRLLPRVEGKRRPPFAVGSAKTKFLHIGVCGAFERIDARTLGLRSELPDHLKLSQQLVLYLFAERVELRIERIGKNDGPHPLPQYGSAVICRQLHTTDRRCRCQPFPAACGDGSPSRSHPTARGAPGAAASTASRAVPSLPGAHDPVNTQRMNPAMPRPSPDCGDCDDL